jgi:hypothetical protein
LHNLFSRGWHCKIALTLLNAFEKAYTLKQDLRHTPLFVSYSTNHVSLTTNHLNLTIMDYSWLTTSWTAILMVIVSSIGIYIAAIFFTRLSGLRSFSKMSSFDFAMTVAVGSLIASAILTEDPPLFQAVVAMGALYALQIGIAKLRGASPLISKLVDNQPTLLMKGPHMLDKNLKLTKVTPDDLRAKLREANVTDLN